MKKYFTTPIYYVNDVPHIGSTYCSVATETLARYWRKKIGKENVLCVTGTDENSQKTVDAALKSGKSIPAYLEEMANVWEDTWKECGLQFDDFIRTTEERHIQTVNTVLTKIHEAGDIYKGKYEGKYCTGCEAFLKDSDLDENGQCPDHKKTPEIIEEENYFFKLSQYQDQLLKLYADNPNFLLPEKRRNEVVSFIKSGLEDISISREGKDFGIQLPWDSAHAIYVWFDALINYYTVTQQDGREDFWPEAVHILGKDITKFHCIIWPAMLMSAGIPLPTQMFAHGFFTVNGTRMSKTLGNVVSPLDLSRKYGNDALRIGLLANFEFGNDGDFSLDHFHDLYAKKLAGGVGNLFNRVIVLVHKFFDGSKAELEGDELIKNSLYDLINGKEGFNKDFENFRLKEAIDLFFDEIYVANKILNDTEPWKLIKTDEERTKKVFGNLLLHLEALTEMAEVILPETAPKMKSMLGDEKNVGEKGILFPPVEKD